MAKYMVTIMGKKVNADNNKRELTGFIKINGRSPLNGVVNLIDIEFNPLELLGDLRYISENMSCRDEDDIFYPPYDKEPCLDRIEITDIEKYFVLLDNLKDIIYNDKCISLNGVYQLANFLNIPIWYNLQFKSVSNNDLEVFKNINPVYMDYSKKELDTKDFIYVFECDDISQIIVAVFTFLILFNYHFFKCAHCNRYSAEIRHQKNSRYCERLNVLNMPEYYNITCREAIPKVLNTIYQSYVRKHKYLYNRMTISDVDSAIQRENEYNSFKDRYSHLKDEIKKNPSVDNITRLKDYLNSIVTDRRKKSNSTKI